MHYLGWGNQPSVQRFHDERMTPERAHIGRWREDFPPDVRREIGLHDPESIRRLRHDKVTVP